MSTAVTEKEKRLFDVLVNHTNSINNGNVVPALMVLSVSQQTGKAGMQIKNSYAVRFDEAATLDNTPWQMEWRTLQKG